VLDGVPFSSDVVFIGNDGGLWRLDGSFVDASAGCASRIDETTGLPLAGADLVGPQNFFDPLPWHARWDSARTLLNRASGGDVLSYRTTKPSSSIAMLFATEVWPRELS